MRSVRSASGDASASLTAAALSANAGVSRATDRSLFSETRAQSLPTSQLASASAASSSSSYYGSDGGLDGYVVTAQRAKPEKYEALLKPGSNLVEYDVAIVRTDTRQDPSEGCASAYTVYDVCIRVSAPTHCMRPVRLAREAIVSRRYREFHKLNSTLTSKFPHLVGVPRGIPRLPPKVAIGRLSEECVRLRRVELEKYLQIIVGVAELRESAALSDFLCWRAVQTELLLAVDACDTPARAVVQDGAMSAGGVGSGGTTTGGGGQTQQLGKSVDVDRVLKDAEARFESDMTRWIGRLHAAEREKVLVCKICYDRPVHVALQPCGHALLCDVCVGKFEKCPVCRVPIRFTVRIFF
eukprot:Opistho-2@15858